MPLYEFYGDECPHCVTMMPLVDKLAREGIVIEKKEVWNDSENAKLQAQFDTGMCGGVPFFMNTDSGHWICGATDEESLRKWAAGEEIR